MQAQSRGCGIPREEIMKKITSNENQISRRRSKWINRPIHSESG